MPDLILLRHGQSLWNERNLFTGWHDVPLTERGRSEAAAAGLLLRDADGIDITVVHTSLISRAIITAQLALETAERSWVPVRRHWRLNERHYGALQGKDKKETRERYGDEQLLAWRRGFATPPPPLDADDPMQARFDPRYRDVPVDLLPSAECLADVVIRALPYHHDAIVPDLLTEGARGGAVLVVGAAFGIHSMSSASVPGIDGAPTNVPSASASTLDMAKVSALMQKITSNPKDTASLQGLASLYFQAGDYKNSAVFSQKVVTLDPKNDLSWVALGAAQFNQGQNDAAKASWVKATFLNPKNAEAHYDLGFYYLSGSKPDQAAAKKEWAAVIAIDPKSDLAKTVQTHMASLASAAPSAK